MTAPLSDELIQYTVNIFHAHNYSQRATAQAMVISRSALQNRLRMAEERKIKPRVRVKNAVTKETNERVAKVVWFTDAHNQPGMSLERFEWLAALVNEVRPDYLIDGGDFDDMNSLCGHEKNDTWSGKFKPSFEADLAASREARELLDNRITHPCEKHFILGNHEDRLYQYENVNPEVYGMMQHAYEEIHSQWAITPYKAYLDIEGVDFTHIPMSGMNKPLGGARCAVNVAVKSIRDCCFGHTHVYNKWREIKLGPDRSTLAINGGCFMPDKYVPKYAKNSAKDFWYGCHIIEISEGQIIDHKEITMRELKARYSVQEK